MSDDDIETIDLDDEQPKIAVVKQLRTRRLPRANRKRIAAGAGAVLVLAGAVGTSVHFHTQSRDARALLAARDSAQEAACQYAPKLATYDAAHLDDYFKSVLDGATGDWHTQFDTTSKDLRDVLTQGQVVSKATDVQCAIRSGDRDSAEAVVVIGQTITSLGTQGKPAPGQLAMVMRLQRSGDRWLVNKVDSTLGKQQP